MLSVYILNAMRIVLMLVLVCYAAASASEWMQPSSKYKYWGNIGGLGDYEHTILTLNRESVIMIYSRILFHYIGTGGITL